VFDREGKDLTNCPVKRFSSDPPRLHTEGYWISQTGSLFDTTYCSFSITQDVKIGYKTTWLS